VRGNEEVDRVAKKAVSGDEEGVLWVILSWGE